MFVISNLMLIFANEIIAVRGVAWLGVSKNVMANTSRWNLENSYRTESRFAPIIQ